MCRSKAESAPFGRPVKSRKPKTYVTRLTSCADARSGSHYSPSPPPSATRAQHTYARPRCGQDKPRPVRFTLYTLYLLNSVAEQRQEQPEQQKKTSRRLSCLSERCGTMPLFYFPLVVVMNVKSCCLLTRSFNDNFNYIKLRECWSARFLKWSSAKQKHMSIRNGWVDDGNIH